MKAYYGIPGNYIDVTGVLESICDGDTITISPPYNSIFDDPCEGRSKHLRIDHERLPHPVYIKEDTHVTISTSNIMPLRTPINIVYFLNTRVNPTYIHLVRSQLEQLKRVGLVTISTLYVEAVVDKDMGDRVISEVKSIVPSAIVHIYEEDFYEYHGIHRVWQLSQANPDNITLYFHSKGISHIPVMDKDNCRHPIEMQMAEICIDRWIQNLTIMSIFPSIEKLGHSTGFSGWIWHNFWWAKGSYLSQCEEPVKTRRRHYYEDWIARRCKRPLPYSHMERGIDASTYQLSISNCYGYYSNNASLPVNIGEHMEPIEPCQPTVLIRRPLLKIDPCVQGRGLFNQLNNLVNSIVLAHMTGRDIYTPRMCPDVSSLNSIPWENIIDMDALRHTMNELGLSTNIVSHSDACFNSHRYRDFLCFHYNFSMNDIVTDIQREVLDIDIGCCMVTMMEDIAPKLLAAMKLTPPYASIVDLCSSKIGDTFSTVHLRVEDDWVESNTHLLGDTRENISARMWEVFSKNMGEMFSDDNLYICTYLGKAPNANDWMLEELRKKYHISTTPEWRSTHDLQKGREIDALIDYMIGIRGKSFLGYGGSTFSHAIDNMMKVNNHESRLIAI